MRYRARQFPRMRGRPGQARSAAARRSATRSAAFGLGWTDGLHGYGQPHLPAGQSMFCPTRQSTPVGSTITKSRIPHGPVPHCPGMKDGRATTLLPIGCSKCRSFMQSYPWGSRNQRAFFLAHRLLGCMQSWQLGFRFPNGSVWSESCRRRSNLRCTAG